MRTTLAVSIGLLLVVGSARSAHAEPLCMSVDEFNAYFAGGQEAATDLTLDFTVTGVNPADFPGTKGCLADFQDDRCSTGAAANLKVYGPYDPPNASHPAGTLKFEFGNQCCAVPPCQTEGWSDPGTSATVFVDGTEQCTVHIWLNPAEIGYHLDCTSGVFDAVGDNVDGVAARQVALLRRNDGGWAMPNAVASSEQICFEPPAVDPSQPSLSIPVLEDVTAEIVSPDTVYPVPSDLSVESGDSELFLKFDLSAVAGEITSAQILLHLSDDPSAAGTGGDACAVADNSWSENTLTWNSRPACSGPSLARVSPTDASQWYSWDVSAAVHSPKIYSFAIVPEAGDTNGSHFFSKEGSPALEPQLKIEYGPGGGGNGGTASDPAPPQGGSGGSGAGLPGNPGAESSGDADDGLIYHGCGCRIASGNEPQGAAGSMALVALALGGLGAGARRRASRRAQ